MSVRDELERALARRILRLPTICLRVLGAHRPLIRDGNRLDPRVKAAAALLRKAARPKMQTLGPVGARREMARFPAVFEADPPAIGSVRETVAPGPAADIPLRIYAPQGKLRGTLVFFHGGGGVVGDLDTYDKTCRNLSARAGCVVASVGYRLAPEHPFPAGVDDCIAAFRHVRAHGEELGCPAPLAVGGDSMGGCLAAVVAQALRDADGPDFQLLIYPVTNAHTPSGSRELFARGFFLERELMDWFHTHYLGDADGHDPRAAPLRASSLEGVAPAHVVTAGFDPLRDEGEAYANALAQAGVDATHVCESDQVHGFLQMTGISPRARTAVAEIAGELAAGLDAARSPSTEQQRGANG